MSLFARHQGRLAALAQRGRYRELSRAKGRDFASNDYLGLAGSELLSHALQQAIARGVAAGAGGSRLLRGNHDEHIALEAEAAAFFGAEAALFMGGGFQANQAIFSHLPMSDDLVLYDELIHASAHEGLRLGSAERVSFRHNDTEDAERAITAWRAAGGRGRLWIALETIYSMQGDFAPLAEFEDLAARHDAVLVLDEAHATGLFGVRGQGLGALITRVPVVALHTCGKALGVSGALICADQVLIDTLINRARPFIYATAPSPLLAAAVRAAIGALQTQPGLITRAEKLRCHAQQAATRFGLCPTQSQILPVMLGEDHRALQVSAALQHAGFDVRAIRPPTVAKGAAQLRISITGNVSAMDIDALFSLVADLKDQGVK